MASGNDAINVRRARIQFSVFVRLCVCARAYGVCMCVCVCVCVCKGGGVVCGRGVCGYCVQKKNARPFMSAVREFMTVSRLLLDTYPISCARIFFFLSQCLFKDGFKVACCLTHPHKLRTQKKKK